MTKKLINASHKSPIKSLNICEWLRTSCIFSGSIFEQTTSVSNEAWIDKNIDYGLSGFFLQFFHWQKRKTTESVNNNKSHWDCIPNQITGNRIWCDGELSVVKWRYNYWAYSCNLYTHSNMSSACIRTLKTKY